MTTDHRKNTSEGDARVDNDDARCTEPVEADVFPASTGQERLWLLAEAEGSTAAYAVPFGYHLDAPLSADRFRTALEAVVDRHDALRTGLVWEQDELRQHVHRRAEPELAVLACDTAEEFRAALREAATRPFDLERPPLLRALHATVATGGTAIGFVLHHSVCDSWSLELFMRDLTLLLDGGTPEGEPGQYPVWSQAEHEWLAGEQAERARDYWYERVGEGTPPLNIGRAASRQPRRGDVHRFAAPAEAVDALVTETGASRFAVMLAAFAALLRRYSTNERVSVGLPLAGRDRPGARETVGYLSNTVVVAEDYTGLTTFRESAASVLGHVMEGLEHGGLPFQDIVHVAEGRRDGTSPLYQAMFGPQNTPVEGELTVGGVPLTRLAVHNGTAKCDLTLLADAADGRVECELEYDTDLFDAEWADRFCAAYGFLLQAAALTPDAPVDELLLLDPGDLAAAFAPRADADIPQPEEPAHAAVEAQARRTPDAVAVSWPGGSLTYRQLDRRANAMAARLAGLATTGRVGILLERGPGLVCAVLATLKAGLAFVPLDPRFPLARVAAICADADVSAIVAGADRDDVTGLAAVVVPDEREAEHAPEVRVTGVDLAYIYYTSGSTGRPKGVPLDHRCVMIRLAYMRDNYPVAAGEAVLHKTPLIFDIAIWELFLPLFAGGTVVIAEPGRESDSGHIGDLLRGEPIVLAHFVPSALQTYLDFAEPGPYPRLRCVVVSGEAVRTDLLRRAGEHFGVAVHVQYGQTETSEVTVWDGEGEKRPGSSMLGYEVGAYSLHVVDPALQPLPRDVPGELCVAAPGGLAWGYEGRPALTADRFVPHPDPGRPGERLYRTGDLVRMPGSGLIEYLGRTDHQLKIRGCRVEPGEIESVICTHPGVHACVVTVRSRPGEEARLVAHVIGAGEPPTPTALAEYVQDRLAWFMVPAAFVLLTEFPHTMSGKIDRDRLPPPGREAFPARPSAAEPAAGPLESAVAEEWTRVLDLPDIGRNDDFFLIGGSSLSVVRLLGALGHRFDLRLSIVDFTRRPTVAALATAIENGIQARIADLSDEDVAGLLEDLSG